MGFDRLMEDTTKKQWMIEEGKKLLTNLMKRAEKVIIRKTLASETYIFGLSLGMNY